MGALYLIGGIIFAGVIIEALSAAAGDGDVGTYDYNFAMGVGAVFGARG